MNRLQWVLVVMSTIASVSAVTGCARTVSRDELGRVRMEGWAETVNAWWYMGTADGYHWFHNTRTLSTRNVRIKADQLRVKRAFPLTFDSEKWVRLPWGVWFVNDPRVEEDFIIDNRRKQAGPVRTGGEPSGYNTSASAPARQR